MSDKEPTQTVMRSFKLNKESLDSLVGPSTPRQKDQPLSLEDVKRFGLIAGKLQNKVNAKGYQMFTSFPEGVYRGAPETIIVVDSNAPFFFDDKYPQKLDYDFLEITKELKLPYEPQDTLIDMSKRTL